MNTITRKFKTWMTLPLAAAFAVSLPLAQAGDDGQERREKDRASASYEKKENKQKDQRNTTRGQKSSSEQTAVKGSSLEGMDLIGENGETIAYVDDVIIDLATGEVTAVIASTGFLGIGGEEKRLDVKNVEPKSLADRNIKTTLTNREFQELKSFDESQLELQDSNREYRQGEVRAMSLRGRGVSAEDGGHVGEVDDWIVSLEEGSAPYMILRKLPLVPTENRYDYYAISSDTLRGLNEANDLVLGVSDEQIVNAERIGEDTALSVRDEGQIYVFKYSPSDERTSAASQRLDD